MKKYIKPTILIASIANETLLAGSPDAINETYTDAAAMSNQRSVFDWNNDEE